MTKFSELGLAEPVLKALAEEGYETPTPIQAQAIPVLLKGADLLGIAQTGTGKTAAFALPLLTRIANDRRPAPRRGARILVLSPTRELAAQIGESFRTYGRHLGANVAVVFGGVTHKPQIKAMAQGVDVLVATPGRLLDHMETGAITLEGVEALVLDEADQMLDLGFVRPIRRIVSKLRARRQNLFFSATMPHEIADLAGELLHEPVRVQVTPVATTAERVSQRVIHIEVNKKRTLLANLFADPAMSRTLVFTRTKRGADRVARHLETAGIPAVAIHGNKSQRQREVALDSFRKAKTGVLVATDIAARGIDIDGITHVINFELPEVPEAYVHRIGRTARAGAEGHAISLCDGAERDQLRSIERLTRQQIPAEDRRNDATIAVDVREKSVPNARPGNRPQRSQQRSERGGDDFRRGSNDRDQRASGRNEMGDKRKPRRAESGRPMDGRPQEGRFQEGRAQEGRAQEGRPQEGRAQEGRPHHSRRDDSRRDGGQRPRGEGRAYEGRGDDNRRDNQRSGDGERAPRWSNGERSGEPRRDDARRPNSNRKPHGSSERRPPREEYANRDANGAGHKTVKPHRKGQSYAARRPAEGTTGTPGSTEGFTEFKGDKGAGAPHRHGTSSGRPHHRDGKGQGHAPAREGQSAGHGQATRHGQGKAHGHGSASGNKSGGGDRRPSSPWKGNSQRDGGGNGSGAGRPQRHNGGERRPQRSAAPTRRPETV